MALILADRVQEITTTSGTGTITLSGAVPGFQEFSTGIGNTNSTYYTIFDSTTGDWEVGIGTVSTGVSDTLSRDVVLSNSLGTTAHINLAGNQANVFVTYPSEKSVNLNADGVMEVGQPLGYADTDVLATFVSTVDSYNQIVVQNKSNGANASSNINISNNVATDTTGFAELGINSSGFVGTGSFSIPEAAYLASAGTDLTIGTYSAHDLHFVTNSNTTDAMTIHDDGGISLGGLADPGIGNIACNNINLKFQQIVTSGGTTVLTNASPYFTQFTGVSNGTLQLPDATTCLVGTTFILDNDSLEAIDIADGASTVFDTLIPGGIHNFVLEQNGSVAGTWLRYSLIPSEVEWGTNSLSLATTVITGGTWQGGTIQSGYGGTGLSSFGAANYALYSTDASTLTAGTLPVAAGGTGRTSIEFGNIPFGNNTNALQIDGSFYYDTGVLYTPNIRTTGTEVHIGFNAGLTGQGTTAVAVGNDAGLTNQGGSAVAIGSDAANTSQGTNSIAIGVEAAFTSQGVNSVAIGNAAASDTQGTSAVAIGDNAGNSVQGANSIAIGTNAGNDNQGPNGIAIGNNAGAFTQGENSIAIGSQAGGGANPTFGAQGIESIAIGVSAASGGQNGQGVAIGAYAADGNEFWSQSMDAIAIGYGAGNGDVGPGVGAIAIGGGSDVGYDAGQYSIAIGHGAAWAGDAPIGDYTIAIGYNAANAAAGANSIILNATGTDYSPTGDSKFFVKPVAAISSSSTLLAYNNSTGEISHSNAVQTDQFNNVYIGDNVSSEATLVVHGSSTTSPGNMTIRTYTGTDISPVESIDWPTPSLSIRGYDDFTQKSMLSFGYSNDAIYQTGDAVWCFRLDGVGGATTSSASTNLRLGGPGTLNVVAPITSTGNITAYFSSDARLKENIQDVDNALDKVCAIGSKTFDWTDEYIESRGGEDGYFVQKSDFGVVAQDVQEVFPQAVRTREDGTLAVDYEKLATLAFGAIKELVKRVEALEVK